MLEHLEYNEASVLARVHTKWLIALSAAKTVFYGSLAVGVLVAAFKLF